MKNPSPLLLLSTFSLLFSCLVSTIDSQSVGLEFLQQLYQTAGGSNWKNQQNWTFGDPCTEGWYGVQCANFSGQAFVKSLNLTDNNLSGYLPSNLSLQNWIESIDLSNNSLTGEIPDTLILSLYTIFMLDLRSNQLTSGLSVIEKMPHTSYIDLSHNQINEQISTQFLKGMQNISYVSLSHNSIYGQIPIEIFTNPSRLVYLDLGHNNFSSSLPDGIQSPPPSLSVLKVREANLNGAIPSWVLNLKDNFIMQEIELSGNFLNGSLPPIIGPNSLQQILIGSCNLTGQVPFLSLNNATTLDFSANLFSGALPDLSTFLTMQSANFSFNQFNGSIPDSFSSLNSSASLQNLLVNNNQLGGSFPAFWQSSVTYHLDVRNNKFNCPIPSWCSSSGNGLCEPCLGESWWVTTLVVIGIIIAIVGASILVAVVSALWYRKSKIRNYSTIE